MTVHRFIPAHPLGKHGEKTACGIKLRAYIGEDGEGSALDAVIGGTLAVTEKGKPFDCPRCRRVLEIQHNGKMCM